MYKGRTGRLIVLFFAIPLLNNFIEISARCTDYCSKCIIGLECIECTGNRWGSSCEKTCIRDNCKRCAKSNGFCKLTSTNFLFWRDVSYECPPTCRSCDVKDNMLVCNSCDGEHAGYPHCQYSCERCIGRHCQPNHRGGAICTVGCLEGYSANLDISYRTLTGFDGPFVNVIPLCIKCKDNCMSCSSLWNCNSCVPGTYGQSCEHHCDPNCINSACKSTNGVCVNGCKSGYHSNGASCDSCPTCSDCKTDPCISSCCHATSPLICSVKNCDKCIGKDINLCKGCLYGYRVTDNRTCASNRITLNTTCKSTNSVCDNGCKWGYYTNGATCESCPTCSDCRSDPCKSSCCQVTSPLICSVNSCDICRENDLDLCKGCLQGYRVTDKGTCESISGIHSPKGGDDDSVIVTGVTIGSSVFVLIVAVLVVFCVVKRRRLRQVCRSKTETGEHINLKDMPQATSKNIDGMCRRNPGESRINPQTVPANYDVEDENIYEEIA